MADILDGFFFRQVSATGFGIMRVLWAATALAFLLGSAPDIVRYWSDSGTMPRELGYLVFRNEYRFTLLNTFTQPTSVMLLWCAYATSLAYVLFGMWTRTMTIIAVLLMFSFHERNLQPLGGGDTLLRNIGFILMIAPEIRAFSLDRLEEQWNAWTKTGALLAPLRTHIWPYRLLLWQFIIIYLTSVWDKFQGDMWLSGTSIAAIFHHTHFFRWPKLLSDLLAFFSPYATVSFLIFEVSWALLLIPRELWWVLPERLKRHSVKRWILAAGVFFHGGIAVLMDVGTFSFAIFAGYTGLLLDRDFVAFRALCNRKRFGDEQSAIGVLYDGNCRLCKRSMFGLLVLDHLKRLRPVNFRDAALRKKVAPEIAIKDLDRALHIKLPDGRSYGGFDAFRQLAWNLPALWFLAPVLYIPGIPVVGRKIYAKIADSRYQCADGTCTHGS